MKNLHAKSPCCRGEIIHYGNRRRQCLICRKTWRIRRKKRGRKRKREQKTLLVRYLQHQMPPLYALEGGLIIIADAMVKYIERVWYTFYFILIRDAGDNHAIITKPVVTKGTETQSGWREAFERLPETVKPRIKAVVCDGHRGIVNYAKQKGWIFQRCHFHLIASIQGRRSKWKWSRHKEEGQKIYDLARYILKLEETALNTNSPQLRKTLLGFINNYRDFRTYLYHSNLNLPRTNNSIESLIGSIQNLCYRARGFRTISSLIK